MPKPDQGSGPEISFVIVSWNAREYLLGCIRSIEITCAEFDREIIVVDNESSDGSAAAVAGEFPPERFEHIEVIRSGANTGFAAANNIGLSRARGRFLILVNPDVEILPDSINVLIDFMKANPACGIAGPRVLNADGTLQESTRREPTLTNSLGRALAVDNILPRSGILSALNMHYPLSDAPAVVDVLSGCFWMVRREAFEAVGPLDENFFMYSEDVDWCRRFAAAGYKPSYVPDARTIHFGGGSSANAPVRFFIELQRASVQYWRKHHGRLTLPIFLGIMMLGQVIRLIPNLVLSVIRPSGREIARHKVRRGLACIGWLLTFPFRPDRDSRKLSSAR